MRTKAIKDLTQLGEPDFFNQLSDGIASVTSNASLLALDAETLEQAGRRRGSSVLAALANEEAAKALIMLDAVRCPRHPPEILSRQLSYFNQHLPKGIYAEATYWKMPTFDDLKKAVEDQRQKYYLDGPNDVDWIFRNRILAEREQTLYIDYVATDQGHYWHVPRDEFFLAPATPASLTLAASLAQLGCTSSDALQVIAQVWRPITMVPAYPWNEVRELSWATIKKLDALGLVPALAEETLDKCVRIVLDSWQFPMYSLDLSEHPEDNRPDLRAIQSRWSP